MPMSELAEIIKRLTEIEKGQAELIGELRGINERESECRMEVRQFLRGNGKLPAAVRIDRLEQFAGGTKRVFWSLLGGALTAAGGALWLFMKGHL